MSGQIRAVGLLVVCAALSVAGCTSSSASRRTSPDLRGATRAFTAYIARHNTFEGVPSKNVPLPACPLGNLTELVKLFPGLGVWTPSADTDSSVLSDPTATLNCDALSGQGPQSPNRDIAVISPTSLSSLTAHSGHARLSRIDVFEGGTIYAGFEDAAHTGTSPGAAGCEGLWFGDPGDIAVHVGIRGADVTSPTPCVAALKAILAMVIERATKLSTSR